MTSAGRVLILPKGEYSASTTYNMLDMVRHEGGSFVCKQTSTGNAPDPDGDTEYWQLLVKSSTADVGDISELITIHKNSTVAAINELAGMINNNRYYAAVADDNGDRIKDTNGDLLVGDWRFDIA